MCLCLLLCAACSGRQVVVSEPEMVRVAPPALLTSPTPEPACRQALVSNGATNGDLLRCYGEYQDALARANADKAALKKITEAR